MTTTTTHLLDMETDRFAQRWPERPFPAPLCGAAEMGPVDLTPYGGVVTCQACREWHAARKASLAESP